MKSDLEKRKNTKRIDMRIKQGISAGEECYDEPDISGCDGAWNRWII